METSKENTRILSATYLHDYVIRFVFNDGKTHDLDFHPFLSKIPQNPMISKYLDVTLFQNFKIISSSDISWNNREMCFDFDTLYYGFKKVPTSKSFRSAGRIIRTTRINQKIPKTCLPSKLKKVV
jgi:hypothetical protein